MKKADYLLPSPISVRSIMAVRLVYPSADAASDFVFKDKLISHVFYLDAAIKAKTLKMWSLLDLLVTIDLITETDLLDVLDEGCNGVRIATSTADEFSLSMYVYSKSLYSQMCLLVDSHNLQWPDDLAVFVQLESGMELNKS